MLSDGGGDSDLHSPAGPAETLGRSHQEEGDLWESPHHPLYVDRRRSWEHPDGIIELDADH